LLLLEQHLVQLERHEMMLLTQLERLLVLMQN